MSLRAYKPEDADALESDLDSWVKAMRATGESVPDFWDELCASEQLAEWLAASGYRKITEPLEPCEGMVIEFPENP